jgi:DNA-binding MarR family transcriptional regulator
MTTPAVPADLRLRQGVMALVRELGLLQADRTPCGVPISVSAAHALTELSADRALTQSVLGKRLSLEKSTVSRLVADLEHRGWVERSRDTNDARARRLCLTPQGQKVAEQVSEARSRLFARIVAAIPADEREPVQQALDALVRAVRHGKEPQ